MHKHTLVTLLVSFASVAALSIAGCGETPTETRSPITAAEVAVDLPPVPAVTAPSTTTTSTTLPPTTTTAPPTAAERVNALVYSEGDAAPATEAYRVVAEARGWTQAQIAEWEPFVVAVMYRESRYCYNLRRGGVMALGPGCVLIKQGPFSDSGFGQVIRIHYGPGQFLCEQENLCSADDIVANPFNSMTALLALLERNGRQPWCYTASLRAGSICRSAPKSPPAIAGA